MVDASLPQATLEPLVPKTLPLEAMYGSGSDRAEFESTAGSVFRVRVRSGGTA